MNQKSLSKNAIYNFIKCFATIIFPIISFPYASRILLPEGIGKVNFANSVIEYFVMFAELGITTYAAREAAKIRDDQKKLNKFAREMLFFNLISTLLSYLLLFISFIFISKFNEYRTLIIISATKILFATLGMNWLFTAKEEYGYITARHIFFQAISVALLFIFVHSPSDLEIYAAIGVFSNVGANIFNLFYSRKFVNLFVHSKIELRKHIKPVTTFFGIQCASKINNAIDAVMLGFMVSNAAVGFYTAAAKLSKMVIELITSVVASFMPRSSYYVENGLIDEYKSMINKVCGVTFFFSFPAAVGLFFLCEPLILLFSGEEYLPAANAMKILSIGMVGWCANSFLNNMIITPNRKEKFTLISQVIAALFNIIFNLIFIKKLEVFGAALATVIVEFIWPFVLLIPAWKYVKSIENLAGIIKAFAGSMLMFATLYLICNGISNSVLKIISSLAVGCIVYALSELMLRHQTAIMLISGIKSKLFQK